MSVSPDAAALHRDALVLDLHCDLLLTTRLTGWRWDRRHRPPLPGSRYLGHVDLPRLREGGVDALSLGIVTWPFRRRPAPQVVDAALDLLHAQVRRHPEDLVVARTVPEIRAARAGGRVALLAGLEGVHALGDRVEPGRLAAWRDRGLASVGLVHFTRNAAGSPMVGRGADRAAPLGDLGRALQEVLEDLDVRVDVAHLNRAGLLEVCARARKPVLCTHTSAAAVHPHRRALQDDEIRAVAATGGVVGVIFAADYLGGEGVAAVADHLHHLRAVAGPAHVGIGSDWEGWVRPVRGLGSASGLPALTALLLRRGWPPEDVRGALGENALRCLPLT